MATNRRKLSPETDFFFHSATTTVYLLHFERKVGRAQHYLGSTTDLNRRLREHRRKWPRYQLTQSDLELLHEVFSDTLARSLDALAGKVYRRKHTFLAAIERQWGYAPDEGDQIILLSQAKKHTANGLVMAANQRNIPWRLVMAWPANRHFEKFLKQGKHAQRICPLCHGEKPDYEPF